MNKPRVALVFPYTIQKKSFFGMVLPSLGLEKLGAEVEDIADVELFDARFESSVVDAVVSFRPTIVAISAKTTMYSAESYRVADELKKKLPDAVLVMGGLHATHCPQEALEHVDYVIRGDGEISFRKLVQLLSNEPSSDEDAGTGVSCRKLSADESATVDGLAYVQGTEVVLNEMAEPVMDLDAFKPPARHLRKPHYRYMASGLLKMDCLETSRGCTHTCSFCSPGSIYPCKYRYHSPEYLINEIQKLADNSVQYCMLTDDHFGGGEERLTRICDLIIERDIRIAFFAFIRPFKGNMELKRKMVSAGFVFFSYGAESPHKSQLNRYGKGYPEAFDFIHAVNEEWLEAGAKYIGNSFVFGDVKDSLETLENLGIYARHLNPTFIEPLYSQPYPGTRYRDELQKEGLLLDKPWSDFTESRLLVRHPEVKDQDHMRKLRAKMWLDFFSPRKAAGIYRAPLFFHYHVGVGVLTMLRYMKACDYIVFGCLLENKPYEDLQVQMVHEYFKNHLPTFEEEEMVLDDMCQYFDQFADMVKMGWLKRLLGNRDVQITVMDGKEDVGSLVISLNNGHITNARVYSRLGDRSQPPSASERRKSLRINIPLSRLAKGIGAESEITRVWNRLLMGCNVCCFDIPRRLFSW